MTRPTAKRNQVSTSSLLTWWHGFDESAPKFELRPALLAIKMMTPNQSYSTKLPTPNQLPEQGLTAQQFKSWHIQLNIFLQQFPRNIVFLPAPPAAAAPNRLQEGIYHTWRPSSQHGIYGRIDQLHDSDKATEHLTAAKEEGGKRNAFVNNAWTNDAVKATILADLDRMTLAQRNRDLGLMLAHISTCCYYTEVDDITERSTSLAWIWTYLQKHYNIAPKGANFLRIASVSFSSGDNHYAFYKKFRSAFLDNLRKTGAKNDARWSDERLTADEQLSPSFEDSIVLWALEKIDPRLPEKVRRDYEHYLTDDCYLSDLHPRIFQSIPTMLEDLDQAAHVASLSVGSNQASGMDTFLQVEHDDYHLQAFNYRGGRGRGSQYPFNARGAPPFRRGYGQPFRRGGGGRGFHGGAQGRGGSAADKSLYALLCSVCKSPGHKPFQCPSLASISAEDKQEVLQSFLASMTLQETTQSEDIGQDNGFSSGMDINQAVGQGEAMYYQPQGQGQEPPS